MKRIVLAVILCLTLSSGCDQTLTIDFGTGGAIFNTIVDNRPNVVYPEYEGEFPTVNLDKALRQENWLGNENEGSCVHATFMMLLRWQGRDDLADYWKANYENGEWPIGLADKCDMEGIKYAYTSMENDVSFLEWACNTRRGCGVTVKEGAHMVMLVHLDAERAGILDNNHPGEIKWVARDEFIAEWMNSRSWAVTPIMGPPPSPLPCEETQ